MPAPAPSPALRPPARRPPPQRPRGPSPQTLQRRRQVLAVLAAATVLTGFGGLLVGGRVWLLFLLSYVALSGYIALLVQLRTRREEAQEKLHYLDTQPPLRPLSSGVRIRAARGA